MKAALTTADTEDTEDAQRVEAYSSLCAPSASSMSAVVHLTIRVIQCKLNHYRIFHELIFLLFRAS
jgi:hypothetical protein